MTARWHRCLAREGAELLFVAGRKNAFAVFADGDRRRRPLARLRPEDIRHGLADGVIAPHGDGYQITEAGRQAVRRDGAFDDGFGEQHRRMVNCSVRNETGQVEPCQVNALESPLGRFAASLTAAQLEAGERFRGEYLCSTLHQPTTRNWSADSMSGARHGGNSIENASIAAIAAKDRVMAALDELGSGLDDVVLSICIREDSLSSIERRFGWARGTGRTILKLALDRLARHYRI
jgi:hypothetical protein